MINENNELKNEKYQKYFYWQVPVSEDGVNFIQRTDEQIPIEEQKEAEIYVMQKSMIRPMIGFLSVVKWLMIFFCSVLGCSFLIFLFCKYKLSDFSVFVENFVKKNPIVFFIIVACFITLLFILIFLDNIAIGVLRLYQKFSPEKTRRACLFKPTCSEYAILSIKKYGTFRAIPRINNRLDRCNGSVYRIDYP